MALIFGGEGALQVMYTTVYSYVGDALLGYTQFL